MYASHGTSCSCQACPVDYSSLLPSPIFVGDYHSARQSDENHGQDIRSVAASSRLKGPTGWTEFTIYGAIGPQVFVLDGDLGLG